MDKTTFAGGCVCDRVHYEVRGAFEYSMICHCSECRRATGSAFKAFAGVTGPHKVEVMRGQDAVMKFGDEANHDVRCRHCGSLLYSSLENGQRFHVALGSLADDPGIAPACHIYVGSKASWYEITDSLPQFMELPG